MMLGCGIAVLLCALRREDLSSLVNGPKIVTGLPLALSFDNFFAGAGISSLHYPAVISALIIGLVSAAMSCIGLYLSAWIKRFVPSQVEFAAGAYLCLLAGRALLTGGA
jgi:putative Mn2+ efflux pump MntP